MRRASPMLAIGLALVTASTSACATYQPRASRFISQDAAGIHHRDGRVFEVGMFGGGAASLVSGDPRALEYARRYKQLNQVGLAVYFLGLATVVVAPWLVGGVVPERARTPASLGAIGLGLGITVVGGTIMFKGNAALLDAVNVYNDDVADPARAGRP